MGTPTKQTPQVLIVGEISNNFRGAYEALLEMEKLGQVELIYRECGDDIEGYTYGNMFIDEHQPCIETNKELLTSLYKGLKYDSISMINCGDTKQHKHPHWYKGRW